MLQPPSTEVEALINAWFDVQLGHNRHGYLTKMPAGICYFR
jgi:hypothetical protein